MSTRPCLDCGEPTQGSRCQDCDAAIDRPHNFGNRHNRVYDSRAYRALRRRVISRWIRKHGHYCPGVPALRRPPHPAHDLELDHRVALANGGSLLDEANADVLCSSCNRAKSGRQVA